MPKRSKKSDSDPPSDGSNALEILEEGIEIEHTKAYGVGIDCHSKFIQVSVIVKRNLHTYYCIAKITVYKNEKANRR